MRDVVLAELKKRIDELEKVAKPGDIETGMSGSFICFNYYLQSHTAMAEEEFKHCVYDDWLEKQHQSLFEKVNNL